MKLNTAAYKNENQKQKKRKVDRKPKNVYVIIKL